jgi:hypothetical protein
MVVNVPLYKAERFGAQTLLADSGLLGKCSGSTACRDREHTDVQSAQT